MKAASSFTVTAAQAIRSSVASACSLLNLMPGYLPRIILLGSLIFASLAAVPVVAADVIVGANLVNEPYKQSIAEQESTFRALQAAGVRAIRAGIPNNGPGIEFARRAYAHGIKIVWLVGIYPDPGTRWPREPDAYKGKSFWRSWPLSSANAEIFREKITAELAALESKGVVLAAFELGNEINWTGFNADFPLPAKGRVLGERELTYDPEGRQIANGYLRYLETLRALKDIRDHSRLNRHTPIVSAGLADLDDATKWLQSVKADAVSVAATLHFLRTHGLDGLVDGYGLHFYPFAMKAGTAAGLADLRRHLQRNGLTECQPLGSKSGKPCWITEWNFNGLKGLNVCPIDDTMRIAMVREMRAVFGQLVRQQRLQGSLFYTWQGNIHAPREDPDSAYLCGALTASGMLALALE